MILFLQRNIQSVYGKVFIHHSNINDINPSHFKLKHKRVFVEVRKLFDEKILLLDF